MHRRRALLLAPAALLLAAAAPQPTQPRVAVAATPISRMETSWWRARHEAKLAEATSRPIDVVWLGDSITQNWELNGPEDWRQFARVWTHYYGDRHALNLGFVGDSTAHLLWRMQNGELAGLHPKVAIILIGANNLGRVHWNAPQTVAGIQAVIDECGRRLPGTKIVLLSVLPSIRSKYVTRTTEQINRELSGRYANRAVPGVTYVDVTNLFMKDSHVDRDAFYDDHLTPPGQPLHPAPEAQARLAQAIEPTLAAILGDRPKTPLR